MNSNFNRQYSARHRIFFAIHSQQNTNNNTAKQSTNNEQTKDKPVCFWTDEAYVSER